MAYGSINRRKPHTCGRCRKHYRLEDLATVRTPEKPLSRTLCRQCSHKPQAQKEVASQLREQGWKVFERGWPDLLAIKDGQALWIEVKKGRTQLREKQREMHAALQTLGIVTKVWRVKN